MNARASRAVLIAASLLVSARDRTHGQSLLVDASQADPGLERVRKTRAACAADLTTDQILAAKELNLLESGVPYVVHAYALCLAVAKRDEAACGVLDSMPRLACPDAPFNSSTDICKSFYGRAMLSKALIAHDPSARALCLRRGVSMGERAAPASKMEAECDTLLDGENDVARVCARAAKEKFNAASDTKSCETGIRDYWGLSAPREVPENRQHPPKGGESDPKSLVLIGGPHDNGNYLVPNAAAGFRKAHAAGDPALCGSDPLCLAMMGAGPDACRVYASEIQEAKRKWCATPEASMPSRDELAAIEGKPTRTAECGPAASASVKIEWVAIPGGSFIMGAGPDAHRVDVPSFQLAKTLVTNRQYRACVKAGACKPAKDFGARQSGDEQPVLGVDWNDARAFASWVGARLPSEAEWEYAARSGGKERKFPWGDEEATCARAVISEGGRLGCGRDATWPVCSKPAGNTEQGLCDMTGELWEWLQDWWHDSYKGAPTDGSAWEYPAGSSRVQRGGSWISGASRACSSCRSNGHGGRWDGRGIRPAR